MATTLTVGLRRTQLRLSWAGMRLVGPVSRRAGGALSARLWFTPWPSGNGAVLPAGATPVTVDAPSGPLDGYGIGGGPTVLLVHGWSDRAVRLAVLAQAVAAAGFRAVAIDLPGHGDRHASTDGYEFVAAIRAAADQIEDVRAVVAHSLGALATVAALRDGMDVDAVVLLAPAVRLDHAMSSFVDRHRVPARAADGLRAVLERRFGTGVWDTFAADRTGASADVPALVVHDRGDRQVDVRDSEALTAIWPQARLHVTEGLGHNRLLRAPEVVTTSVDFLRGVVSGAPGGPTGTDTAEPSGPTGRRTT